MFIHLFIFLIFTHSINCWIFNNIKNGIISRRHSFSGFDDDDITPNDLADLRISLIYPGTKWCGAGNIADGYDDLGTEEEADFCCREHDNCPDVILAGESKYNLTNNAFYSRLSCQCDLTFRKCLHDAQTKTAQKIGLVYFDVLGTKCFREDFPTTGCKRRSGWLKKKCVEYLYDETAPKRYQWFDVPNYN
ncbi:phospholipase A2-like [Zerene cesonia]|uniref:phospholipase A2-like n=1 Tax=Zerene cesonia TaxID=33412 RepID=UPI0018E51589|nr:phospholipase A2-like [Zerene cesonia]